MLDEEGESGQQQPWKWCPKRSCTPECPWRIFEFDYIHVFNLADDPDAVQFPVIGDDFGQFEDYTAEEWAVSGRVRVLRHECQ